MQKEIKEAIDKKAWEFYWRRQPKGTFLAKNSRPDMVIGYVEAMRVVFERMDLTVANISEIVKRMEKSLDDSGMDIDGIEQKTKHGIAEISQKIESLKETILGIQK